MRKPSRFIVAALSVFLCAAVRPGSARQAGTLCGTYRERVQEDLLRHRAALRFRSGLLRAPSLSTPASPAGRDLGPTNDLAVFDESEAIVARPNLFNLNGRTVTFTPSAAQAANYRFSVSASNSYDAAAAAAGTLLAGFGDDDARQFLTAFPFPFYGSTYNRVFVNSDGNLTFGASDTASNERSLGRMTAGPPRIAPLFSDLDPTQSAQGVLVLSDSSRFVVTWVAVPEYADFGTGRLQTFQVRLYPSGRIEFAYSAIDTTGAVIGIAPGDSALPSTVVSFLDGSTAEYGGAIAERFGTTSELDLVALAQTFYQTHDDAYDYLVVFNNLGIPDGADTLASERTLRSNRRGIGEDPIDVGREFGSARRLQAVINMGPLGQYRALDAPLARRPIDTPITVLAHETGHLFLAYASVRDPADAQARPMLGYQNAHWSFNFDSDASVLEGNRIEDRGAGISPRFLTTGVSEGYSPLDQYLMGLRAAEDVGPLQDLFYVTDSGYDNSDQPRVGVRFDGDRHSLTVQDLIAAEGRRIPDQTVAQREFRFAFLLVVPSGADPSAADIQNLEDFRAEFAAFFAQATSERATASTELRRALDLSLAPAGGVLAGATATVSISLEHPADEGFEIALATSNGYAAVPSAIAIRAGAWKVTFPLIGIRPGVDELTAAPSDPRYETARTRIQVAGSAAGLTLALVSGADQIAVPGAPLAQPVVMQVVDQNQVPYAGILVTASAGAGGSVIPVQALTDDTGLIAFTWTPGAGQNRLTASIAGTSAGVTVAAFGPPVFRTAGVVNAASYKPDVAPGSLASVFGVNLSAGTSADAAGPPWPEQLSGVEVRVNGAPAAVLSVRDLQVNLVIPASAAPGPAVVTVVTPAGSSGLVAIELSAVAPGIFFDAATGIGAIRVNGDFLEIYATGLGAVHPSSTETGLFETDVPVKVSIGGKQAEVAFNGLAPGFTGLYQVNARIPDGMSSGRQLISIEIGGKSSNVVGVQLE